MNRTYILLAFFAFYSLDCISQTVTTVPKVDLEKYSGKWYEIAAFPQRFQKGCYGTTATYSQSDKGYIIVENHCFKDSLNGKESSIKGKAFVDANSGNSKLKVQFFWPFKGKYWIIDLADDYSFAVVGHPDRDYLWILSRTPEMDAKIYAEVVNRIQEKKFDVSKLKKTVQIKPE
ncbi:lipocalin family protein [Lutimonas sp.]|uniref:lipocalin family protein n=1 Tax=Lutimonas sp. TaxID=1872403 RepID=UPI003D9BF303